MGSDVKGGTDVIRSEMGILQHLEHGTRVGKEGGDGHPRTVRHLGNRRVVGAVGEEGPIDEDGVRHSLGRRGLIELAIDLNRSIGLRLLRFENSAFDFRRDRDGRRWCSTC